MAWTARGNGVGRVRLDVFNNVLYDMEGAYQMGPREHPEKRQCIFLLPRPVMWCTVAMTVGRPNFGGDRVPTCGAYSKISRLCPDPHGAEHNTSGITLSDSPLWLVDATPGPVETSVSVEASSSIALTYR